MSKSMAVVIVGILCAGIAYTTYSGHHAEQTPKSTGAWSDQTRMLDAFLEPLTSDDNDIQCVPNGELTTFDEGWTCTVAAAPGMGVGALEVDVGKSQLHPESAQDLYQAAMAVHWSVSRVAGADRQRLKVRVAPQAATYADTIAVINQLLVEAQKRAAVAFKQQSVDQARLDRLAWKSKTPAQRAAANAATWPSPSLSSGTTPRD